MTEKYGTFTSEKEAEQAQVARELVNEILNLGITQKQLMIIIHSLALNIENVEKMQAITAALRELDSDTFLVDRAEEEQNG